MSSKARKKRRGRRGKRENKRKSGASGEGVVLEHPWLKPAKDGKLKRMEVEGKLIDAMWTGRLGAAQYKPLSQRTHQAAGWTGLAPAVEEEQPQPQPASEESAPAAAVCDADAQEDVVEATEDAPLVAVDEDAEREFYQHGAEYWKHVDADADGMLGGFAHISSIDVRSSKAFLKAIGAKMGSVIDCGAGIGRVSRELLLPLFKQVDLVEQNPDFVDVARKQLSSYKNMRAFYAQGLQTFVPEAGAYDVIWIQWVIGHLPDDSMVSFLQRCAAGLKPNGVIVVKENVSSPPTPFDFDDDDGSVTRSDLLFRRIFAHARLGLVRAERQQRFPAELFPVWMYALRPM